MNEQDTVEATLIEMLGYTFGDRELMMTAVTHKSFANEAPSENEVIDNERLEFLGDAVLSLVISQMLMDTHPQVDEGGLSRMRAALVNEKELAATATRLDLGVVLRLGKGEQRSGGRSKTSILADLFEALLGAVFLDGGLEAARSVAERAFGERLEAMIEEVPGFDPKSRLQVLLQQRGQAPPRYELLDESGPDHRRRFTVSVLVEDLRLGEGTGSSKKQAEQAAARLVLASLEREA